MGRPNKRQQNARNQPRKQHKFAAKFQFDNFDDISDSDNDDYFIDEGNVVPPVSQKETIKNK